MTSPTENRVIYLDNRDLMRAGLRDWAGHLHAIEYALLRLRAGTDAAMLKPRLQISGSGPRWTGYIGYLGPDVNRVCLKWLTRMRARDGSLRPIEGLVLLSDAVTGDILAVMQGSGITAARTAVTSALGCLRLAPPNAGILSILGSGVIGDYHLQALTALLSPLRDVVVWNRGRARVAALVARAAGEGRRIPTIADTIEDAVRRADILICAVAGGEALVRPEWLKPGTMIVDVGEGTCEIDVVRRATRVFVDWRGRELGSGTQALDRAVATGLFDSGTLAGDLTDVAAGAVPRASPDEVIYLASIGLPIEDLAVASRLYDEAIRLGLGTSLPVDPLP